MIKQSIRRYSLRPLRNLGALCVPAFNPEYKPDGFLITPLGLRAVLNT